MLEIGWSPIKEIEWSSFEEIRWSSLEEIGWVYSEEILHRKNGLGATSTILFISALLQTSVT